MKKIFLVILLTNFTLQAKESTDKELIHQLITEVQLLKKEVSTLKKSQVENNEDIEEISTYTEKVEANSFQDKLNFGLSFRTNLDNFSKKYADGHKVSNNNIWSTKLMLNMKADITKDMNFYGRLSMYKYWGSSYIHPYTYYDNMQGRVPADSALYVERAYINWFLFRDSYIPLALTIGRQPSSDGPSNQYKNNTVRKGTYSALLYDGAADGFVFTANISKLIKLPKSYLRFGYAKGFGYTETSPNAGNPFIGASNNDIKDTNVYGLFFDTSLPQFPSSFIQISYSQMRDIVANPLDANSSENTNIGNVDLYGAMIEFTNIKRTHLDLFAQYGHSVTHPNQNSYLNYGGLLTSNGDTSTKSGNALWIGGRYGFTKKEKFKLGLEYNHGTKNWINLTQGSFDIYNKLSTRGDAYEAYLMYVINRYSTIRLGYIYIDYDYTNSGWFVGESQKISTDMTNSDSVLQTLDSIYLKMNINF
jgi:hypothetical protein